MRVQITPSVQLPDIASSPWENMLSLNIRMQDRSRRAVVGGALKVSVSAGKDVRSNGKFESY